MRDEQLPEARLWRILHAGENFQVRAVDHNGRVVTACFFFAEGGDCTGVPSIISSVPITGPSAGTAPVRKSWRERLSSALHGLADRVS